MADHVQPDPAFWDTADGDAWAAGAEPLAALAEEARWAPLPAGANAPGAVTERLRAYLAKQPGGACSFCHGTHWHPYWAQIVVVADHTPAPVVTKTLPALHLECAGCGQVLTINAAAAGILVAATE